MKLDDVLLMQFEMSFGDTPELSLVIVRSLPSKEFPNIDVLSYIGNKVPWKIKPVEVMCNMTELIDSMVDL